MSDDGIMFNVLVPQIPEESLCIQAAYIRRQEQERRRTQRHYEANRERIDAALARSALVHGSLTPDPPELLTERIARLAENPKSEHP